MIDLFYPSFLFILGSFIKKYVLDQSEQPTSKSILGLFVESKMYEYFNENKLYKEPRKFKFKNKWFINEKIDNYCLFSESELREKFKIDTGISDKLRKEKNKEYNVEIVPIEDIDLTIDGKYELRAKGKLNIHGVEVDRIIKGAVTVTNGFIHIESHFNILLSEHNIKIPKVVHEKIASEILVDLNADLTKKK